MQQRSGSLGLDQDGPEHPPTLTRTSTTKLLVSSRLFLLEALDLGSVYGRFDSLGMTLSVLVLVEWSDLVQLAIPQPEEDYGSRGAVVNDGCHRLVILGSCDGSCLYRLSVEFVFPLSNSYILEERIHPHVRLNGCHWSLLFDWSSPVPSAFVVSRCFLFSGIAT
jgi:hypothetical protein